MAKRFGTNPHATSPTSAAKGSRNRKSGTVEPFPSAPATDAPEGDDVTQSQGAMDAVHNSLDSGAASGADSNTSSVSSVNKVQSGANSMASIDLKLNKVTPMFVLYKSDNMSGSVRFLRTQFGEELPDTVTISTEPGFAAKSAPVKETKEERKARLKARTPQEIAADAQKRAAKAVERANALAAKAAAAQQTEPALAGQDA